MTELALLHALRTPASHLSLHPAASHPHTHALSPPQGVFYDTLTLEPLVDNPAMLATLRLLRALLDPRHAARTDASRVVDMGACLLAFSGADIFKVGGRWGGVSE